MCFSTDCYLCLCIFIFVLFVYVYDAAAWCNKRNKRIGTLLVGFGVAFAKLHWPNTRLKRRCRSVGILLQFTVDMFS